MALLRLLIQDSPVTNVFYIFLPFLSHIFLFYINMIYIVYPAIIFWGYFNLETDVSDELVDKFKIVLSSDVAFSCYLIMTLKHQYYNSIMCMEKVILT